MNYETFEHEADIGIRGFGGTIAEAFENAALAMYSVMVNVQTIEHKEKRSVAVSAPDRELLLIEWLNALLSLSDIERMVFSKFEVKIEHVDDNYELRGTAWGEPITGVGLTLGLLTGAASLVGLMLVVNYGLATQWMSPGQQGFHIVLTALMIAFFFARAGRTWGLDAVLWGARPKSLFARRPFS